MRDKHSLSKSVVRNAVKMAQSEFEQEEFDNLLANAVSSFDTLRYLQLKKTDNQNKRRKKTRGTNPKVVSLKLYHLPEASPILNFCSPTLSIRFGRGQNKGFKEHKQQQEQNSHDRIHFENDTFTSFFQINPVYLVINPDYLR